MQFSVIITTYNRVNALPRAVKSVLSQDQVDFELIVVNDGSTDETASLLNSITDSRLTVINRSNGGLSAARNSGINKASGEWTAFLDDDDLACADWLSGLAELVDHSAGIVCCAAAFCAPNGTRVGTAAPYAMGRMFHHQTGLMLAGTFAVRTDLLRAINGFDERLTCSHQTELAMRLIPAMLERGLHIRSTNRALVRIERRGSTERPMSNPFALYHGIRIILNKHSEKFEQHAEARARSYGVLGVSAARLEYWGDARSALLTSASAVPWNVRRWLRLAAALCPPIGRRVWKVAKYQSDAPGVAR